MKVQYGMVACLLMLGCVADGSTKDEGIVDLETLDLGAADSAAAIAQGELELGVTTEGNLTRRYPYHTYTFEVTQAGSYFVDLASRAGSDMYVVLHQKNGRRWTLLDSNDDCYDGTLNSCVTIDLDPGTYRVTASTYQYMAQRRRTAASYSLTVTCNTCRDDCPDPTATGVRYVSEDPSDCARIRYICEPGQVPFSNECGCGCQPEPACVVGGCSSQLCIEEGDPGFSTCEWREEYACYQRYGQCQRQADGNCGWNQTPELLECIEDPSTARDCRTTGCGAGEYCTYCWVNFACIPVGAVC